MLGGIPVLAIEEDPQITSAKVKMALERLQPTAEKSVDARASQEYLPPRTFQLAQAIM